MELPIIITIICLIFLLVIILCIDKSNNEKSQRENLLIKKYGQPTYIIYGLGTNDEIVYVFEQVEILIIKQQEYSFKDILDFNIDGSDSYRVSTSTGSMLGRGIVGGLVFGGFGALVGAGTASKNVKQGNHTICITTRSLYNPIIEYKATNNTSANELISILKIIIDRNLNNGL